MTKIGDIFRVKDKHFYAAYIFIKGALRIRKQLLGDCHADIAQSHNNLGAIYYDKKDYKKALDEYTISLKIRQKIFGEKSEDIATSYYNIGLIHI